MLTAKINNYTIDNVQCLQEILVDGLMSLKCSRNCDKCSNKIVCMDIMACHRYLCEFQRKLYRKECEKDVP